MLNFLPISPILANCNFDKTATLPIVLFELFVLVAGVAAFLFFSRFTQKLGQKIMAMASGVLIFELFTSPMWHNYKMGQWAYVYHDVSWILTWGWTTLILGVVLLVDKFWSHLKEKWKFGLYLAILTPIVLILEMLVVNIGIRSYAPEVLAATSGIMLAGVPLEILYYVPVFCGLVIAFYKYWSFIIDNELLIPVKKRKWLQSGLIAFLGVFLFEVMIEPMVKNQNLPNWSYIFHDISILMTGMWVLIIGFAALLIDKFFIHYPIIYRFTIALIITSGIAWAIESWLILNGYRVYGESAVKSYTGFVTPLTQLPIELAFAVPFYMALIIAFIRYWETVIENKL